MLREYTALHYVKDQVGCLVTPGEIFEADYDAQTEERLLKLGAVKRCDNSIPVSEPEAHDEDAVFEAEATAVADEAEDIAAPVIDVMEGISAPKRRGRRG